MTADLESISTWMGRVEEKLDRHFDSQHAFEGEMRSRLAHLEEKEASTDRDCRAGIHQIQMAMESMRDRIQILQTCNDRQEILMDWFKKALFGALSIGMAALIWAVIGHIAPSLMPH